MNASRWADSIGRIAQLDPLAGKVSGAVQRAVPRGPVKDALSGTPLGHPLHPLLTDLPIGAYVSAAVLDLAGRPDAARTMIGAGVLSAVPAVVTGLSDWSDTHGPEQRLGVVHAAANAAATALFAGSWGLRKGGHLGLGRLTGLAGLGALTVGAYLGGHLTFARAVGVNHALEEGPDEWAATVGEDSLAAGGPVVTEAGGNPVLLDRVNGGIRAIGARCSHAGGPLGEGKVDGGCVECPWHGSVFRLEDGEVVHGPATVPVPAYEAAVTDGRVLVRRQH